MKKGNGGASSIIDSAAGVGLSRFYLAVPFLFGGGFFLFLAFGPEMYSETRSVWEVRALITFFAIVSGMLFLGAYKTWARKNGWVKWSAATYAIYAIAMLIVQGL